MCAGRNVRKTNIQFWVDSNECCFNILLEGHRFVAASGNSTVNEQIEGKADCFSSFLLDPANNY
jgi:hypothetical protein